MIHFLLCDDFIRTICFPNSTERCTITYANTTQNHPTSTNSLNKDTYLTNPNPCFLANQSLINDKQMSKIEHPISNGCLLLAFCEIDLDFCERFKDTFCYLVYGVKSRESRHSHSISNTAVFARQYNSINIWNSCFKDIYEVKSSFILGLDWVKKEN